ncbi:phenylacetate--CoA ligase family protein [Archaeoglobus veneficus]|uniref:Phenylacetate--CoA ligase n=1 Tax=Archaeoglobus veneficus (strain DSM 11195 / SNP6) TaxID=693661 RepID=F2KSZ2_ARCVS|nr:AMP-binding protein [Archaeoglobus veneficus]AEA47022.1 Phenylacetate--CoA ligase [Archaeoglobus veneficus SNP6]
MNLIETLRAQIRRNCHNPFYLRKLKEAGLKPDDIKTLEDFERIPFMTRAELYEILSNDYGSFMRDDVVRMNLSPSPLGLIPILNTKRDIEAMNRANARAFERAGVTKDDVVMITFGYHIFIAGLMFHGGFEELGAKTIPLGPGSTAQAMEVAEKLKPTVLVANPSFALKLAKEGLEGIRVLIAAGEPFSSVRGYKEKVRRAFGDDITLVDYYGMAECTPVACECKHETGLHVTTDFCYVEVIDPETGERVGEGERGEIVVTHLNKDAMPLQRYRTGDLGILESVECLCGMSLTMPTGVFGRTDEMYKVKGVKIYPSQIPFVLKSFPGLTGKFRLEIDKTDKGTDWLKVVVEGQGDAEQIKARLREALLVTPEVEVVEKLDKEGVEDRRY